MEFLQAFPVLDPKGAIGKAELSLIVQALFFMLIVVIPVLVMLFSFAWWYRASNTKAKYTPNWEHSTMDELVWWAIPFEIILILGALTWTSTQELDPPRPLSSEPPLVVQAVALEWKWLFIYPEQGIATVNYLAMPVGRPVRFDITADAPMNAFWIPHLGGMLYAMTGMTNRLNLVADEPGTYQGLSSNYSGDGFAHMKFNVEAVSEQDFSQWVLSTKSSSALLDWRSFEQLKMPSVEKQPVYYAGIEENIYNKIVMQFMSPDMHGSSDTMAEQHTSDAMSGMSGHMMPAQR